LIGGETLIKDFKTILDRARKLGPTTIAVAVAQDLDVLKAINNAYLEGIIKGVLVGDSDEIAVLADEIGMDLNNFQIMDVKDKEEACRQAVLLVREQKASTLMKGFVDTSVILRAVLNKESGVAADRLLSHVGVMQVEGYSRLLLISDSAMNISPTLRDKVHIVENAVQVARALEIDLPKVAMICAVEKVNPKMPATVDAAEMVAMNQRGEITGCIVGGPFALDLAVSEEAAVHKKISHPVAGKADILITPNLETGNVLNKSMEYFARVEKAGIIMGVQAPIVLTSRASSEKSKLNSIALAVLVADHIQEASHGKNVPYTGH
jgi:phosphate butyryltransferase